MVSITERDFYLGFFFKEFEAVVVDVEVKSAASPSVFEILRLISLK